MVEMKAYVYYDDLGKDIRVEEIPDDAGYYSLIIVKDPKK